MSTDDHKLEVEITIGPAKGGRGGRHSSAMSKAPDPPRTPRITRLMALAIKFQDMIDRGEVRDYADLARFGYVSRARLTQIMNLLLLAPDLQERLLLGGAATKPGSPITERDLRTISKVVHWDDQRRVNCANS